MRAAHPNFMQTKESLSNAMSSLIKCKIFLQFFLHYSFCKLVLINNSSVYAKKNHPIYYYLISSLFSTFLVLTLSSSASKKIIEYLEVQNSWQNRNE